jgi:plastocyanin
MLRLARRATPLGLLLVLFVQANALAATNVSMTNFAFTPKNAAVQIGGTVHWTNDSGSAHTSTSDTPLSLWDSGSVPGGGTYDFVFTAGGQYRYHCTFHQFNGMTGTVSVRIRTSPPSGPAGTVFNVMVASINAPAGFVYDIQKKNPGGNWANWMMNVTSRIVQWDSTGSAPGTYQFRSRLHNTNTGATSGYSQARGVMVT